MTPYERAYDVMNRIAIPGWGDDITQAVADAIQSAVIEERESCANVAANGRFLNNESLEARWGKSCAAAIRDRQNRG